MRIFVTGGTGFLGSYFLRAALLSGHHVSALRRAGSSPCIKLEEEPVWIDGDLELDYGEVLTGVDCVVHLASAGVSPKKIGWAESIRWNVAGVNRLLDASVMAGVRRIIIGGTCQEYGRVGERYERIPVDAPLEPVGAYAASKAAASILACARARELDVELAVLRPFHCFGAGQHQANFWPALKEAAVTGEDFQMTPGEQVLDFFPVHKVADEFLRAAESLIVLPRNPVIKNIGSGCPMKLAEFARFWWESFGAEGQLKVGALPYRGGELMRLVPALSDE